MIIDIKSWPPSVNHYYISRVVKTKTGMRVMKSIGPKGKKFRQDVIDTVGTVEMFTGNVKVLINVYPPDRRKRDLDNLLKSTLDALTHAGVYEDDSLITRLSIRKREIEKGGRLVIMVKEIE